MAKWNVVIVYEDVPAGRRAVSILGSVDQLLDEPVKVNPLLWRFDLLEDPDWGEVALADAFQSDLLILSASSPCDLPAGIQDWLQTCLTQKHGTAAAVVALLGSKGKLDGPDSPRIQFLKNATAEAGLEFFAPGVP